VPVNLPLVKSAFDLLWSAQGFDLCQVPLLTFFDEPVHPNAVDGMVSGGVRVCPDAGEPGFQ
jgi:hypothetical protein